jgi:cation diffusion facilitator CzcD-associated flavoprotein CzcO
VAEVAEHADVVVVGGGQAGLAASWYLTRAGVEHLVLDAEQRVGDAWRRRWDSLELFSAAAYSTLPGLPFPGDPEHFPGNNGARGIRLYWMTCGDVHFCRSFAFSARWIACAGVAWSGTDYTLC